MSSSGATIFTGFWHNRSNDSIHGSTLTLSSENSAFLIAFVALFVKFAGGQLWSVLTFLVSVVRSSTSPQDALYHQQQAILRNTSQPTNLLFDMMKLLWYWEGNAKRSRTRTFGYISSTLAYIAVFAAAGIYSSKIATTNSEVLLVPNESCGLWRYPSLKRWDESKDSWQSYNLQRISYWANTFELAKQTHVQVSQCYNSTHANPNNLCLPYGKSRISWSTNYDIPCPFEERLCIADAIQFDSGFLNSRDHLGINTQDHIEYRRVLTCAPITTDGYVSDYVNSTGLNASEDALTQQSTFDGETFLKYNYGQNGYFNDNTTFAYSNFTWGASYAPQSGAEFYRVE